MKGLTMGKRDSFVINVGTVLQHHRVSAITRVNTQVITSSGAALVTKDLTITNYWKNTIIYTQEINLINATNVRKGLLIEEVSGST
jgi:hypothetical protein